MKRIFLFLIFITLIFAELPNTVSYRGQITDETGSAIDATMDITFNIFDIATGGTSLWSETQSVEVTDGYFDVELGSVTALDLNFDNQYWVELTIGGETLTPRDKLTPTAFAIRANIANKADSSIYSVSSSADHTGRTGHLMFVPGEGSVVTEASTSSESDTIYIAIGGDTGSSSSGSSLPPINTYKCCDNTLGVDQVLYTVPYGKEFLLYGVSTSVNSYHQYHDALIEIIIVTTERDTIHLSASSIFGASGYSINSTPHSLVYPQGMPLNEGDQIIFRALEYYKYSTYRLLTNGSIWGYESDI